MRTRIIDADTAAAAVRKLTLDGITFVVTIGPAHRKPSPLGSSFSAHQQGHPVSAHERHSGQCASRPPPQLRQWPVLRFMDMPGWRTRDDAIRAARCPRTAGQTRRHTSDPDPVPVYAYPRRWINSAVISASARRVMRRDSARNHNPACELARHTVTLADQLTYQGTSEHTSIGNVERWPHASERESRAGQDWPAFRITPYRACTLARIKRQRWPACERDMRKIPVPGQRARDGDSATQSIPHHCPVLASDGGCFAVGTTPRGA